MLFTAMLSGISNLFIYCFFGKLATESFNQMANSLFQSDWFNLPIELQKYYIIIIGNAQQSLFYHGFKIVFLDLETFTKVGFFLSWCWQTIFRTLKFETKIFFTFRWWELFWRTTCCSERSHSANVSIVKDRIVIH